MQILQSRFIYALLVAAIFFLILFALVLDAQSRAVELWDEQTNITVVKDTLSTHAGYLTYQGEVFLEKPPLWYFLTGLLVAVLGQETWVFRLVSIFSAISIVFLLFKLILKRAGPKQSLLFLIFIFLIPQLYVINPAGYFSSHTFASADLDSLQIFFIVLSFFLLFYKDKLSLAQIYLSYFALALGYFSKGPLVLLPLILNSMFLYAKGIGSRKLLFPMLVFFLPVFIWHIFMSINYGLNFWDTFFNYHVFSRSLVPIEGHEEAVWFYFTLLIDPRVNLLGIPFFIKALLVVKRRDKDIIRRYCLLFIVLTLMIFSLIATKIAWYILPLYPFLILFLAI